MFHTEIDRAVALCRPRSCMGFRARGLINSKSGSARAETSRPGKFTITVITFLQQVLSPSSQHRDCHAGPCCAADRIASRSDGGKRKDKTSGLYDDDEALAKRQNGKPGISPDARGKYATGAHGAELAEAGRAGMFSRACAAGPVTSDVERVTLKVRKRSRTSGVGARGAAPSGAGD
ncbi:hypothetical protein SKAU_G00144180 [Synaphobranchus kaupii]|uniref:Uncharacterized protein n=1 Tax=Synaphobranchus kaupii TaxID=118154 RepID=A0A9Q1FSZ4_SYNKA|nr:hypothetical protein SKAU_G00144180 [Synaphobranchus kaupii]